MAAPVRAAREADLPQDGMLAFEAAGRSMLLVRHRDTFYALDAHCFHMGASLEAGDIEDVGHVACVRCPWHGRRVCLETGRELRRHYTMGAGAAFELSDAPVQRTHGVTLTDGFIWVHPASGGVGSGDACASDRFNCTSAGGGVAQQQQRPASPPPLPAQLLAAAAAYGSPGGSQGEAAPGLVPYAGFNAQPIGSPLQSRVASVAEAPAEAPRARVLLPFSGSLPVPPPPPPRCAVDGAPRAATATAEHPLSPVNILKSHGFRARKAAATEAVCAKPTAPRVLFRDPVAQLAAAADVALHGRTVTLAASADDMMEF